MPINVEALDPCITPTATPTSDAGSGGGAVTTTVSRALPTTGSNPSSLAPFGLAAILGGVALLGIVAMRRTKPAA